jgi:hypothetical protein
MSDDDWRADSEEWRRAVLAEVGEPVFGVEGSGWMTGCGRGNGGVRITMRYGSDEVALDVETKVGGRDADDTSLVLEWLMRQPHERELTFPFELVADRWEADLEVADRRVPFVFVGDRRNWMAYGRWDVDRAIELCGRGVDPTAIALVVVAPRDPL